MIIINCEQNSEEWFKEKIGKPSASNASKIITNSGISSKQSEGYLHELVAERITDQKEESYKNNNMIMGLEREEESRSMYELLYGVEVSQVGVVYKDKKKEFLCSPDGIINNKYGLEMKNVLPKTQIKYLLNGTVPVEYFSQIQFSLYVTGFKRWDFMSYSPKLKPLIISVGRDEVFIAALQEMLWKFCSDLKETTKRIRSL